MNPLYLEVASRAAHRCEYCGAPEAIFNFAFEVEHIFARSQGGSDDPENAALACRSCNVFKSDGFEAVDPLTAATTRLFNPRRDRWSEHFQVQPTGEIEGQTSIGRATAVKLRLNSAAQLIARKNWFALGIYPP